MLSAKEASILSDKGHEIKSLAEAKLYDQYITLYEEAIKTAASIGARIARVRISDNKGVALALKAELLRKNYGCNFDHETDELEIYWK